MTASALSGSAREHPTGAGDISLEGFLPNPTRGNALDERMHDQLADSLAHLAEVTQVSAPPTSNRLEAVSTAIRNGRRLRPLAFRAYFRLVRAMLAQEDEAVGACLAELDGTPDRAEARTVVNFGAPEADRLSLELIGDGMRLAPISEAEAHDFMRLLDDEGLDLMVRALPDLYAEVSGIVHEVLLARAPQGDQLEFDGASHYQFWGLLLLNPRHHRSPQAVVEVLAHEASHSLLFGLTVDEPLVLNPDDELYPSPLRQDLRPMEGIYHATYVSARMYWAMDRLSASELLSPEERRIAAEAAKKDRANWERGLSVINEHARLSPTGARILDAACVAMSDGG